MSTVKTTVVFPKQTWVNFQRITGKKRTSQVLSRLVERMVRWYAAQQLINKDPDSSWDDAYLYKAFEEEVKVLKKSLN